MQRLPWLWIVTVLACRGAGAPSSPPRDGDLVAIDASQSLVDASEWERDAAGGSATDSGAHVVYDAAIDVAVDTVVDAAIDAGVDAAIDSQVDAGVDPCPWQFETVATTTNLGNKSHAVDGAGGVHVVFYDMAFPPQVKDAYKAPGATSWQVSGIAGGTMVAAELSLAIDANNARHISYYRDPGELWYLFLRPDGTGTTTRVAGLAGAASSIAVDAADRAHIAYADASLGQSAPRLGYAHDSPTGWVTTVVPTLVAEDPIGEFPSIRIDAVGGVHISSVRFNGGTTDDLIYSHVAPGGSWSTTTVDALATSGMTGLTSSMEVDGAGGAHIAYDDRFHLAQRYAYKPAGGTWTTSTIDPDHVFVRQRIRIDRLGILHLVYSGGSLPTNVVRQAKAAIGGSWTIEAVGPDSSLDPQKLLFAPSIAFGKNDTVHIVYAYGNTLRYARRSCL